jgi:hypothetical protein
VDFFLNVVYVYGASPKSHKSRLFFFFFSSAAGDNFKQGVTAAGLFLAYLTLIVAARPFVRPIENALVALVAFVSLVASLLNVFAPDLPYSARLATSIGGWPEFANFFWMG